MTDLLAEVVRMSASATSSDQMLDRIAQLLSSRALFVLADRLDDPDLITRVAAYDAAGQLQLPDGLGVPSARRSAAGSVGLLPALLEAPHRVLLLDAHALEQLARSDDQHRARQAQLALSLGAHQVLLLGLVARDTVLGVLSLGIRTLLRDEDLLELVDVAAHVGIALDSAKLLAAQHTVAATLQNSLLPALPAVPGLRLAARYSPASRALDVGGDWYDAFRTPAGLVIVVGDASGHDVDAVARMADLRNLLRAHAVDRNETPAALLARLDRTANALGLDAMATCIAGCLLPYGREGRWHLSWTSAGHLPPVLLSDGSATLLDTTPDLMLGVDHAATRTDHELELAPGDVLVMCTDGLVEVRGDSLQDRLEAFRGQVQALAGHGPDGMAEQLLAAAGSSTSDDIALLIVEVQRGPGRAGR